MRYRLQGEGQGTNCRERDEVQTAGRGTSIDCKERNEA